MNAYDCAVYEGVFEVVFLRYDSEKVIKNVFLRSSSEVTEAGVPIAKMSGKLRHGELACTRHKTVFMNNRTLS